jgi:hypothetical protein
LSSTRWSRRLPRTSRSTSCHLPCPSRNSRFDHARNGAFAGSRDRTMPSPSASAGTAKTSPRSSAGPAAPRCRLPLCPPGRTLHYRCRRSQSCQPSPAVSVQSLKCTGARARPEPGREAPSRHIGPGRRLLALPVVGRLTPTPVYASTRKLTRSLNGWCPDQNKRRRGH